MSYVHSSPPRELTVEFVNRELARIEDGFACSLARLGHAFKSITASYTAANEPYIFADATSGAITVTLPATLRETTLYNVKKTDSSANAVTLDGGAKNIDGATTYAISTQYESITVYWDKTQWWIV